MGQTKHVYQWSKQDRALHLLPAMPLIAFYFGSGLFHCKIKAGPFPSQARKG